MMLDPDVFRNNLLRYTTIAFNLLPKIDRPAILDVGCETGVPTLCLAELCDGTIVGVDSNSIALERLAERIKARNLSGRVGLMHCAMEDMPFERGTFDIVWAEGSTAHLGFPVALKLLSDYIRSGGFLVIHDEVVTCSDKISAVEGAGLALQGFFLLSEVVWWEEYYRHLQAGLSVADSATPPYELRALARELEQFSNEPQRFKSAFFIMKRD